MIWPLKQLGDLSTVITKGTTPTTLGYKFVNAGIGFLRVQNIEGGTVNFQRDTLFIDEKTHKDLARSQIQPGDVLVSIAGTIGRAGVVPDGAPPLNCNQAVAIVRTNGQVHRPFLRHWLESPLAQEQMRGVTVTGTISNLSLTQLGNLQLPLPPLHEQKRIAAILDKADAIRRKRQQAVKLTEELLRSVFLDMFGDPVTNPKGWETLRMDEIILEGPQNGLYKHESDYGSGTQIVRIDSIYDGEVTGIDALKRVRLDHGTIQKYLLREDDLLINRVNSRKFLGKSAIVPKLQEPTVFESNMMRITLNSTLVCPQYLVNLLQHQYIKTQIDNKAKDAVNQSSINQDDVKSFELRIPPLALQLNFRETKRKISGVLSYQNKALDDENSLFTSLLQRAFRGEL